MSTTTTTSPPPKKPIQLGDYTLIKLLGKGTHAKVYLAKNSKNEKFTVRVNFRKGSKILFDYRRSVAALRKLDHVNVVKMVEYFEWNHCFVIVLEYLEMVTLDELYMQGWVFTMEEKVFVMKQVADAVRHMSERGVAHRDLKMENVMVDPESLQVKVIDFGYACRSDIICGDALGTPYYMAPEVLTGKKYSPEISDMWSLGVLFFVVMFYELPFPAENIEDLRKMSSSPFENELVCRRLEEVPGPLVTIIAGLLEVDPESRITQTQLSEELSTIQDPRLPTIGA